MIHSALLRACPEFVEWDMFIIDYFSVALGIYYLLFSIYYCSASSVPSVAQTTVLIRNTIRQNVVFYACFFNQSTVTYL